MPMSTKIAIIVGVVIVFIVVTMFPGYYPVRGFESVFVKVCNKVLKGEINKFEKTLFVGKAGMPIRREYIECGVDPAPDANEVCYITGEDDGLISFDNPLGGAKDDECSYCAYGSEELKYKSSLLGKSCKPYRKVWRWKYKSEF